MIWGATDIVVALDPIDTSSLQTQGDRAGGQAFSIPLGSCAKDAKPYITFTDSSNKANRTNILSLSPSSTATGVGLVLEKSDGNLVTFGAETPVSAPVMWGNFDWYLNCRRREHAFKSNGSLYSR